MYRAVILFLILTLLFSCSPRDQEVTGKLTIGVANKETSSGRITTEREPNAFIISVRDESGNYLYNYEKFDFINLNGQLISRPIAFEVGRYNVTDFFILDEEDSIIYLTPQADSELAYFVANPLPSSFNISAGETNSIIMEVLASNAGTVEDFGYAEFLFHVVTPGDSTLNLGLVAYYDFNKSTLNKVSGSYHGNGVDLVDSLGKGDFAYYFNGSSSYVDLGQEVGDSVRSFSFWFNSSVQIDGSNDDLIPDYAIEFSNA